ncbi:NAD(P)H-dependent oxidoreductase [Streptomyces verrucosisporus]|uniref:NAD(P)H-dependent oxidoreductase n=1 Tax=Streptomyces verrucosisporus TaxID=1695161 RepID=UPI0019D1A2DF|nr:NAD(P)H-dependent oxidoreductase [Streptomyces verrucosisporus]MBN3933094.1 NAD(P)H-dependent oxidoreductase [Streptomyces verrucosisporus]
MAKRESVAVAGGGVGGLATAVALARRGVDVTVIERSARIGAQGAGLVLCPDGMRAADALGENLGGRVRELGHLLRSGETRLVMDAAGRILAEEPMEGPDAPRLVITRSALQRALLDESLTAGAAVLLATTVEDYTAHEDGVTVRLSDGKVLRCAALVAADGVDSVVRRRMLPGTAAEYLGHASVSGCTGESTLERRPHTAGGRGVRLSVLPVGGGLLCWTARIASPPGVWPAKGPARARADLIAALTGWYPPLVDLIRNTGPQDIAVADARDCGPAPRRVDGRVVLLGDAACPAAPSPGRVVGTAMADALALADAVAAHDDVPRALAAFQREHRERTGAPTPTTRGRSAPDRTRGRDAAGERAARADAVVSATVGASGSPPPLPHVARKAADPAPKSPSSAHGPHIVLVGGSLHRGSTCDRVAQWCALRCAEQGATVRVFAGADIDFPAYRPGLAPTHPEVGNFLSELRCADGIVLVSPTYHGTVSGLLKNALDYVNDLDEPVPYLEGRAIGCVAVGAAAEGAASTLATLRTIGHAVRGWPTPVGVAVSQPPAPPSADGTAPPEEARLMRMLSQVLWMGRARLAAGQPPFLGAVA